MGAVYAAYDELLDRRIALKLMHRQRGGASGRSSGRWSKPAPWPASRIPAL